MAPKTLNVVFAADSSQVGKAFAQIEGQTQSFGRKMQGLGVGLTAGLTAPLLAFGVTAVKEASEAKVVMGQTEAVIKSTGGAANVTAQQIGSLSDKLGTMAGIEGEVVQESSNLLLTFTKVNNEAGKGNDIFNQAQQAILDMGIAMNKGSTEGLDLSAASIQVGKALNDPIKGVTALTKVGVQFTDQQKEQIKTMVESGDVLGAQKVILGELNTQFAGSAKAAGENLPPFERLKLTLANLAETVGTTLLPFVEKATAKISEWAQKFQELSPHAQKIILTVAGIAAAIGPLLIVAGSLARAISSITGVVKLMNLAFLSNPITWIVVGLVALVAAFIYAYTHSEKFRDIVKGALQGVADFAGFVVSTIISVLQGLVMFWLDTAGAILGAAEKMMGWVPGLGPKLTQAKTAFEDFRSSVNEKFDNAADAAMRWGETTNKAADDTINAVGSKAPRAAEAGRGLGWGMGSSWYNAAKPQFDLTVTEARSTVGRIAGLTGSASAAGEGVGAAAAAGMVRGLNRGAPWVTQAARSVAGAALAAAKYTLGVSSPSKVFEKEIGGGIVSGLVRGLVHGQSEAANAARELVSFGGLGSGLSVAGGGTVGGMGGGGGMVNHVHVYLSGREIFSEVQRQGSEWERANSGRAV